MSKIKGRRRSSFSAKPAPFIEKRFFLCGLATSVLLIGFSYRLKEIYEKYDIRGEDGGRYAFTSHQLRHNGITDRLAAGFTIEQVAEMAGHHGAAMIWNAYANLDGKTEVLDRQGKILDEPAANPYILFGGRILNMDDTELSHSVFAKPHLRAALSEYTADFVRPGPAASTDDTPSPRTREQKLRAEIRKKGGRIKRLCDENAVLREECELLRGRLLLLMQKQNTE